MPSRLQTIILGVVLIGCCIFAINTGFNQLDFPHTSSSLESQRSSNDVASSSQPQAVRGLDVASLLPPLYNNVTVGDAWVFPSSNFDLGAKGMSCECFDPGSKSCTSFSEHSVEDSEQH